MTVEVDHYCQSIVGMHVPMKPIRQAQRIAFRAGRLQVPLTPSGEDGPRFLVRVDEFPYGSAFDEPDHNTALARDFHEIMRAGGLPYLLAVLPRLSRDYLDPAGSGGRELDSEERELLAHMRADGVTFAQHGLDHRSRSASPRRRSELGRLDPAEAAALLDEGRRILEAAGIDARAFVPPFNRFDAAHWALLRDRYDIVCGGPETISALGLQPVTREANCTYVPSYPPYYGRSDTMLAHVRGLIAERRPVLVPITLHTIWEMDGHADDLRRLVDEIVTYTRSWDI
jgi:hypothetical protein